MQDEKLRDKVRGNFLGVAIGDALGKPVETMTAPAIVEKFGRIDKYLNNSSHKWFSEDQEGTTTDDWQLTKAVARAMTASGGFDNDAIAAEHIKEFKISVRGWGGSTREAVARMIEGVHWKDAGKTEKENRGTGNGVCMKVSPVGLYMALVNPACADPPWGEHVKNIVDFSIMTHRTSLAVTSGLAHAFATFKCFETHAEGLDRKMFNKSFHRTLMGAAELGRRYFPETIKDDIGTRFAKLERDYAAMGIIDKDEFGGGTCYAFDSLPFTYAWFMRDPLSINSLYDCASAGGDTDSNASMLAGLLGALHGTSIFPDHLKEGLKEYAEVIQVADEFYDKFANDLQPG